MEPSAGNAKAIDTANVAGLEQEVRQLKFELGQ